MDVQPKLELEKEYAAATDDARRTVAAEYDLYQVGQRALSPPAGTDRYREVWRITLPNDEAVGHLLIAIPWVFPDELPDIFVECDVTFEGVRIPHLDRNRQLCTFDDTTRFPNPERPGQAVLHVIERARTSLTEGVAGTNRADYWEEFEAYWSDGVTSSDSAFSLVMPTGPHRRIAIAPLASPIDRYHFVFAEDEKAAAKFLSGLQQPARAFTARSALYLHLDGLPKPDLRTNLDIWKALPETERKLLCQFLDMVHRPATVLFSIPVGGHRFLAAWRHEPYGIDLSRGKSSRHLNGEVRGFRKGMLRARDEISAAFAGRMVRRIVVDRVDEARLVARTVGGEVQPLEIVNLIGCGSVGGLLGRTIALARPRGLRLVDNETLEAHNVPRHVCDMTNVGMNKSKAVAALIGRFTPSLAITSLPRNALDILRSDPSLLAPAQLTIVAVAHLPVERRVNALARIHDLGDLAIVWIEPHGIAGHAIVVPHATVGCLECLVQEDYTLNVGVLRDPACFELHEAGCRGSFIPYGGVDLEIFTTTITREILTAHSAGTGVVISWIGALAAARARGLAIRKEWDDAPDYSVHRRRLQARHSCPVCGTS
jgi:molybdopterin/thiamine biosynthesis adenylyltransferase